PDDEQGEDDVDRPGHPLLDEAAGRGLRVAVMRPGVFQGGAIDHLNHTKIAHTASVSRMEAASWMRTMVSRPIGSMARMLSHTKWRMPPSMWWNSTQV